MVTQLPPPRPNKDVEQSSKKYSINMNSSLCWAHATARIFSLVVITQMILFPVITDAAILRLPANLGERSRGNRVALWGSSASRNGDMSVDPAEIKSKYLQNDKDSTRFWLDGGMDGIPVTTEEDVFQGGRRDKKGFSVIPRFLPYLSQPGRKSGGVQQRSLSGEDYSEAVPIRRQHPQRPFRPRLRWG